MMNNDFRTIKGRPFLWWWWWPVTRLVDIYFKNYKNYFLLFFLNKYKIKLQVILFIIEIAAWTKLFGITFLLSFIIFSLQQLRSHLWWNANLPQRSSWLINLPSTRTSILCSKPYHVVSEKVLSQSYDM